MKCVKVNEITLYSDKIFDANIVGFAVSDINLLYSDINLSIKIVALDIIDYSLEVDKK